MNNASESMEIRMISQKAAGNFKISLKLMCSPPSTPYGSSFTSDVSTILTGLLESLNELFCLILSLEESRFDSCLIFYFY